MNNSTNKANYIAHTVNNLVTAEFGSEAAFVLVICEPDEEGTKMHVLSDMNGDMTTMALSEVVDARKGAYDGDLSDVRPSNH